MITTSITNKDSHAMMTLYKVRPKLEYRIQVWKWNPFLKKDILLECVCRTTKLITVLKQILWGTFVDITVNNARNQKKKSRLIEGFKILKTFDNVDSNVWFNLSCTGLRGHDYKLFKQTCRLNIRKYFFSQRIIDDLNELPADVVNSCSVNTFKNRLDCYVMYNGEY